EVGAWTYHYSDQGDYTWEQARNYCQTFFTDLVAIQNKREIEYLNASLPFHRRYYWIGIRKLGGTWTWVGTKKLLTKEAENWAAGEPNNRRSNQDCVEIYIKRQQESGKWNDESCKQKKKALCYQASCQPLLCSQRGECVETIGSYRCQCYPGFHGPECEDVVQCAELEPEGARMNCSHPYGDFSYNSTCVFGCQEGFERRGAGTLRCLASQQWSAEIPTCTGVSTLCAPSVGAGRCLGTSVTSVARSASPQAPRQTTLGRCSASWGSSEKGEGGLPTSSSWEAGTHTCSYHSHPTPVLYSPKAAVTRMEAGREASRTAAAVLVCPGGCDMGQCRGYTGLWQSSNCSPLPGNHSYSRKIIVPAALLLLLKSLALQYPGSHLEYISTSAAVTCPALSAPDRGNMNCSHLHGDFAFGSMCVFSCETGFVLTGLESRECTAMATWTGDAPRCKAIVCPVLNAPDWGQLNCSHLHGDFAFSSTCAFSCQTGFALVGPESLKCTAMGTWTGDAPRCKAITCPELSAPEWGQLNCSHLHGDFAFGSTCAFSCQTGFALMGPESRECTATGSWTGDAPRCEGRAAARAQAIKCSALASPKMGQAACSHLHGDFAFSSTCAFSCQTGFVLMGPEKRECTAMGTWTGDTPQCKAISCPVLEPPSSGQLSCSHVHGNFTYNSTCTFSCEEGFVRMGAEVLRCAATGNWTRHPPVCAG
ncbi:LYAM3 protein, partial [Caloenas nicobarica]|nr:LYAM3 protein [Caloenas nicobarica]